MIMATKNDKAPVNPNCMERVPPKRPAMIPNGRPKLRPQPLWIIGTMARTIMEFIPNLISTSEILVRMLIPPSGATRNNNRRKPAMIRRGQPKESMKFFTFSFNEIPDSAIFIFQPPYPKPSLH